MPDILNDLTEEKILKMVSGMVTLPLAPEEKKKPKVPKLMAMLQERQRRLNPQRLGNLNAPAVEPAPLKTIEEQNANLF